THVVTLCPRGDAPEPQFLVEADEAGLPELGDEHLERDLPFGVRALDLRDGARDELLRRREVRAWLRLGDHAEEVLRVAAHLRDAFLDPCRDIRPGRFTRQG